MQSSRQFITQFTLTLTLCLPAGAASAHTLAELCDASQDVVEQCSDLHDCVLDPAVDANIGYCAAPDEGLDFTLCDRRVPDSCGPKQRCRIGTIDPNIGVCDVDPFAGIIVENEEDPRDEEDTEGADEPGCASASGGPSPTPTLLALLALLWGGAARRGQRRSR